MDVDNQTPYLSVTSVSMYYHILSATETRKSMKNSRILLYKCFEMTDA
jgi:hypothetical protein